MRAFAIAIVALVFLPAPRCVQPGVREAAAPCVRTGLTKETREKYPKAATALVVLKHVLAKDELWPQSESAERKKERKRIIEILEDPRLVIEYSAPLVPEEHLKGKKVAAGQTIDENTIRLSAFAGNDVYKLAQTLVHELMHVQQLRYQKKPNGGPREWFSLGFWEKPAYDIEEQLPKAPFESISKDVECLPDDAGGAAPEPSAEAPCPEQVPRLKMCPYAVQNAEVRPCLPGWCWDGGYGHSLACKQENLQVPNAHPTDLNDIWCNDGFSKKVLDRCTKVVLRCE